jgi:dTMP kinase
VADGGRLIAFEGVEGAGKSTQIHVVAEHLRKLGYTVVETREPGGTALGSEIRQMVMHPTRSAPSPMTELLLYLADRAQHLAEVIVPALDRGHLVLCDRFSASTVVYQGYARQLGADHVRQLDAIVRNGVWPCLTLILDCPVEVGLQRARGDDRFHREQVAFHERVRAGFLTLAKQDPEGTCVIDATQSPDEVTRLILERVERCLQKE